MAPRSLPPQSPRSPRPHATHAGARQVLRIATLPCGRLEPLRGVLFLRQRFRAHGDVGAARRNKRVAARYLRATDQRSRAWVPEEERASASLMRRMARRGGPRRAAAQLLLLLAALLCQAWSSTCTGAHGASRPMASGVATARVSAAAEQAHRGKHMQSAEVAGSASWAAVDGHAFRAANAGVAAQNAAAAQRRRAAALISSQRAWAFTSALQRQPDSEVCADVTCTSPYKVCEAGRVITPAAAALWSPRLRLHAPSRLNQAQHICRCLWRGPRRWAT